MGCHDRIESARLLPKECRREVNRVQSPELRWHRLRRAIENDPVNFHELQRLDDTKNRCTSQGDLGIGESNSQTKPIERTQTFRFD